MQSLTPLPTSNGERHYPPRFIFAWSSDLKGADIESEFARYVSVDNKANNDPAATILCIVGKGYCCRLVQNAGGQAWYKIGDSDGVQEVVDFIGGIANSLIDLRMRKFGIKFGNYIGSSGQLKLLQSL